MFEKKSLCCKKHIAIMNVLGGIFLIKLLAEFNMPPLLRYFSKVEVRETVKALGMFSSHGDKFLQSFSLVVPRT